MNTDQLIFTLFFTCIGALVIFYRKHLRYHKIVKTVLEVLKIYLCGIFAFLVKIFFNRSLLTIGGFTLLGNGLGIAIYSADFTGANIGLSMLYSMWGMVTILLGEAEY